MQSSDRNLLNKIKNILYSKNITGDVYIRDILVMEPKLDGARYGEFALSTCSLIVTPELPDQTYLKSLPHANKAAYVIVGEKIYYKKDNEFVLTLLPNITLDIVNKIKRSMNIEIDKPDTRIKKNLLHEKLKYIASVTKHRHQESLEDENHLVARMVTHISKSADVAKEHHLRDNSESKNNAVMKEESKNNITRLIFNEFAFFPSEKQGPLSQAAFIEMMNEIEKMAINLPQNLHLLIASIPVINDKNEVHNVVCYVQCGNPVKINIFAKSIPSSIDCLYPGTTNAFISSGSEGRKIIDQMKQFYSNYLKNGSLNELEEFKWRSLHNPDYPPPKSLEVLLNDHIQKLKLNQVTQKNEMKFVKNLYKEIRLFEHAISIKNKAVVNKYNPEHIPPNIQTLKPDASGYHYGGNFEVMTAGGIKIGVNIDICLENLLGTTKKAYHQEMTLTKETVSPHQLPSKRAHIVTSGTVSISPENIIGNEVTHADLLDSVSGVKQGPEFKSENPENIFHVLDPTFGDVTVIMTHKPKLLNQLTDENAKSIDEHNQFMIKIQAIKHVATQQPRLLSVLNNELIEFLTYEATTRSEAWNKASHSEKLKWYENVKSEVSTLGNLVENERLGKIVSDFTKKIQNYFTQKNALIEDVKNIILLRKNESFPTTFFRQMIDSNDEIRISAAHLILEGLVKEKEIKLTDVQIEALADTNSNLGSILLRYSKMNVINDLLPPALIKAYKKLDNTPSLPPRGQRS